MLLLHILRPLANLFDNVSDCIMQASPYMSHCSQSLIAEEHRHKGSWETSGLHNTEDNVKGENRLLRESRAKCVAADSVSLFCNPYSSRLGKRRVS